MRGAARRGCLRADAGDLSIAAGGWMLRRRGANPPHTHSPWHTHGSLRFVIIVNTANDDDNDNNTFLTKLPGPLHRGRERGRERSPHAGARAGMRSDARMPARALQPAPSRPTAPRSRCKAARPPPGVCVCVL